MNAPRSVRRRAPGNDNVRSCGVAAWAGELGGRSSSRSGGGGAPPFWATM